MGDVDPNERRQVASLLAGLDDVVTLDETRAFIAGARAALEALAVAETVPGRPGGSQAALR